MDDVVAALKKLDNLEELYEVTGEFDIVSLLSASDIEEFREVLKNKIMKIKGVKSTVSSVVLMSHKGPRCTTEDTVKDVPSDLPKEAPKDAKPRLAPRQ
jgi:DNA-binding Lrp family transcriptional regulator